MVFHVLPQTTNGLGIPPWKRTDFTHKLSFSNKETEIQRKGGTHLWSQKVDSRDETKSPNSFARIIYLLPLGRNTPLLPLLPYDDFIATLSLILKILNLLWKLCYLTSSYRLCDGICHCIIGLLAMVDCCPNSLELEEMPNMLAAR